MVFYFIQYFFYHIMKICNEMIQEPFVNEHNKAKQQLHLGEIKKWLLLQSIKTGLQSHLV